MTDSLTPRGRKLDAWAEACGVRRTCGFASQTVESDEHLLMRLRDIRGMRDATEKVMGGTTTLDELRKGLAKYLERDPETIGYERSEGDSYTWTLLDSDATEGWRAVLWLADNAPPGTSHGVPRAGRFADATHCHICGLRLKVIEQRKRGADVWRKTRCPSGTCPNGKQWQTSIRRVEKPKRAKPGLLTDRPVRRPVQSADELNFGPRAGMGVIPLMLKGTMGAAAYAGMMDAIKKQMSRTVLRQDLAAHQPAHATGAEVDEHLAEQSGHGAGIQVDALRVGQRWRNPEDTETRTVESHRWWLTPHLHVGDDALYADPDDCVADGWRCIADAPGEAAESDADGIVWREPRADADAKFATSLCICPDSGRATALQALVDITHDEERALRRVCKDRGQCCSRVGRCRALIAEHLPRIRAEARGEPVHDSSGRQIGTTRAHAESQQPDPWSTYLAIIAGIAVVHRTNGVRGVLATTPNLCGWKVDMGPGAHGYANIELMQREWRPLKPARVEAGQRWQLARCDPVVVPRVPGAVVSFANDRGSAWASVMLTSDDWTWLPEGES